MPYNVDKTVCMVFNPKRRKQINELIADKFPCFAIKMLLYIYRFNPGKTWWKLKGLQLFIDTKKKQTLSVELWAVYS